MVSTLGAGGATRPYHVVPVAVEAVAVDIHGLHLLVRDSATRGVLSAVQPTDDFEAFRGGRAGDQVDDRLVVPQRFTSPVRGNEGDQAMFDLIPLAGARRKMTHGQRPPRLVGELLQLPFPQAQARPVAAASVRRDEHGVCLRVQAAAFRPPPAPDGGHRKRAGVMVRPHVDEALVAPHVVDAVGIRARHIGTREIVALHAEGLLRRTPLLAGVGVVADQVLLLGVDRNDRAPAASRSGSRGCPSQWPCATIRRRGARGTRPRRPTPTPHSPPSSGASVHPTSATPPRTSAAAAARPASCSAIISTGGLRLITLFVNAALPAPRQLYSPQG